MSDLGKDIRSALITARHVAHNAENAASEGRAAGGGTEQVLPLIAGAAPAIGNALQSKVNGFAKGGAAKNIQATPSPSLRSGQNKNMPEDEPLFDYSRLHETPKVPQVDLPRDVPPRGVPARVTELTANKDVRNKMLGTIQEGLVKGGANWYNTDPLRDEFIKRLGKGAGDQAHRQYMEFVAATSPRSEVGANARNASYYHQLHMSGQPMPAVGDENPQPYGHMAQRLHQQNARTVTEGGWNPKQNPKPASFVENLAGNQRPVTVDTHVFRLPALHARDPRFLEPSFKVDKDAPVQKIQEMVKNGEMSLEEAAARPAFWQSQPKSNEYGAMEHYYQGLAKELGITPAQAQAAAWVGGGKITGLGSDESKPFLRFFQDRIYKTARETGMDPKDVLDQMIRGKMPLRADGGAVENALRLTREYANGGEVSDVPQEFIDRRRESDAPVAAALRPFSTGAGPQAYQSRAPEGPGNAPAHDQEQPGALADRDGRSGAGFGGPGRSGQVGPQALVRAIHEPTPEAVAAFSGQKLATPVVHEFQPGAASAQLFHHAISQAKAASPEGAAVHVYEPHEYENMRPFLTPDRMAGFALKGDDIVSVFRHPKSPHKRVADALLHLARQRGGHRLDAFDTVLPHIYGRNGFKATGRDKWDEQYRPEGWDEKHFANFSKGRPDVVYMEHDPAHGKLYERGDPKQRAGGGSVVDKALAATAPRQQLNPQGLYSHAAAQAQALSQAKGSGQQMLASLKGVKPEELANSGAAQKFAGQPSVTRDELASHFRRSLPKIQETRLSESDADDEENEDSERPGAPNFEEYTIPGGENYRELLLHTPAAPPDYKKITTLQGEHNRARIALDHYLRTNGIARVNQDPEYARVSAEERSAREALDVARKEPEANNFYHKPHWGNIPNVVAHLRLTDRTVPTGKTPESDDDIIDSTAPSSPERRARFAAQEQAKKGEKVLHMEELQSDWGQQGREKGFREDKPYFRYRNRASGNTSPDFETQEALEKHTKAYPESLRAQLRLEHGVTPGDPNQPPKGPYVGNTNGWTDLGLKRALREVALGKYDRLAWTPGQEQADRYGLAKKLSHLAYHPGVQRLLGTEHGASHPAIEENDVTPEKLPSYVGKELAERLLASEKDANGAHSVVGKDLQVGAHKMKKYYDEMVPGRLKEIVKKLGHEAKFEPLTIRHKPKPGGGYPDNMKTTLHSMHITPELRERILKGMPAYASGGAIAKKSPSAYAAGGGIANEGPEYDAREDGPFYHVARRGLEGIAGDAGGVREGTRQEPADDGRGGGPLLGGTPQPNPSRQQALKGVADAHAAAHGNGPVVDEGNLPASLHKQSAIGTAFGLAATDRPDYKRAVFEAYKKHQPHVVKAAGARNYDELRAAAYHHLGKETSAQFDSLPIATSYHRNGEGSYASSPEMLKDLHENGHLNVFRGGDRHDFLHNVDPRTGLNETEKFRAVHDAIGHGVFGNGFGPQGEERAWNAHRQTFSPLAQLALASETRGQNSYVNYTPLNAQLLEDKHKHETNIATAKRMGWRASAKKAEDAKAKLMKEWQYAPQKAVLLPPEMTDPGYAGGMPDYVQKLMKPEPGTGMSAPVTHYSPSPDLKELDPSRYGTGIAGDEAKRLQGSPGAVAQRSYAYLGKPGDVPPEPGLGSHAYVGQAHDLYDMSKDPLRLAQLAIEANRSSPLGTRNPGAVNQGQSSNDMERMARERGFQGVANPNAAFPMAALFNKTPVQPVEDPVRKALNLTAPAGG